MDLLPVDIIYLIATECDVSTLHGLCAASKTFRDYLGTDRFKKLVKAKSIQTILSKYANYTIRCWDTILSMTSSESGYTLVSPRVLDLGLVWFELGNSNIATIDHRDLIAVCIRLSECLDIDITPIY